MHGISTVRLSRAITVEEDQDEDPTPVPTPPIVAQPAYGPSQRTISQWMESKSFPQVEKSDTPQDVLNKLRNITNTLTTEMRAINGVMGKI